MQKTLMIIKPDALCKRIIGKIFSNFEKEGFKIIACQMVFLSKEKAELFYAEHNGRIFFPPLVEFMSSNPCLAMVWKGKDIISKTRKLIGNTDPALAEAGTIRKLYASDNRHNIVHSSDSAKSAEREIEFFFDKNVICEWEEKEYIKY